MELSDSEKVLFCLVFPHFLLLRTQIFNMWFPTKIFIYPRTQELFQFQHHPFEGGRAFCTYDFHVTFIDNLFESHQYFNLNAAPGEANTC